MNYKKYSYIIAIILMMIIGMNNVFAWQVEKCNYVGNGKMAMAQLEVYTKYGAAWAHGGKNYTTVHVQKLGNKLDDDTEEILNWYKGFNDKETGITLNAMYNGSSDANDNGTCPEYIMVRTNNKYSSYGVFAANDQTTAKRFVDASNQTGEFQTWYLWFKNSDGTKITDEQYYDSFIENDVIGEDATLTCSDLFGDKNDAGNETTGDPPSIANMIHTIMSYVRIIVPIIVIVLGSLDLAKAVVASKEDEMKKAQTTFIKRLILGVAIFFVPLLVDLVMYLADLVWEGMGYSVCEFK